MQLQFSQWVLDLTPRYGPTDSPFAPDQERLSREFDRTRAEMQKHMDQWTDHGWTLVAATEQTAGYGNTFNQGINVTRFTFFWRKD